MLIDIGLGFLHSIKFSYNIHIFDIVTSDSFISFKITIFIEHITLKQIEQSFIFLYHDKLFHNDSCFRELIILLVIIISTIYSVTY